MTTPRTHSLSRWLAALAILGTVLLPAAARAWWNDDWTHRTVVSIDTGPTGAALEQPVPEARVALRLHSGNFDFAAASLDGSDLRVVAADDKTQLPFEIERYDSVNELALLWVRLPSVLPATDKNVFHVYAGHAGAQPSAATPPGPPVQFVLHFSEASGPAIDPVGRRPSDAPVEREANGLLGGALKLGGKPTAFAAAQAPRLAAGSEATVSLWIRPDAVETGTLLAWGPLKLAFDRGAVVADFGGGAALTGGRVVAGQWNHVALASAGGRTRLFVGGTQAAESSAALPELAGELAIGAGTTGLFDELRIESVARGIAAMKLAAGAEGPDPAFVKAVREAAGASGGEGHGGYIGILVKNLTVDAWVVIGILAVMFAIAAWVMVTKAIDVVRIDRGNRRFLERFRNEGDAAFSAAAIAAPGASEDTASSLERLHRTGLAELKKRDAGRAELSGAAFNAVKAVLDADLVRESHALNARMVLLTIAISGGPFLGLLGTVVGVMITFAAIAAAGDVNVNAIAPGIAAALLATVAGLGVAIPALFGYNWLAARIKNIGADMQIFVDEFITRAAEAHGGGR